MNTRTTQPDRSTPVTDIKPAAVERIHLPMQPHQQALHTLAAVRAGMPLASARRWPHYLDLKDRTGQRPIELHEAVGQCIVARLERVLVDEAATR